MTRSATTPIVQSRAFPVNGTFATRFIASHKLGFSIANMLERAAAAPGDTP